MDNQISCLQLRFFKLIIGEIPLSMYPYLIKGR